MKIRKTQWQSSVFVRVVVFMYFLVLQDVVAISEDVLTPVAMSKDEKEQLKEESREMFYHAYRAYMDNAYPADELMPLSCAGRYRGITANRGDMDDILGNFSLTLVDTLDSLVILGDFEEFEHAVKLVINDVSFDSDIVVSVFETNIRMLGGLLSAHVLTEYLQRRDGIMLWYEGELLNMAKDLGYRLLPAFNTTTGIPHARINLRHGMKVERLQSSRETCTACAGTMVLEMAALSRLTGEPIFEVKAHRAMDELWKMRHRSSDLMGTVLNIHSGDWVRRDSGVGAGIDSYYEYCLKAYILLGEDRYLNRFNRHYTAVMKYISQGPMLLDVHMHRPHTNSRNFMDALLAFWPGLQVLMGDLKPAVETHEMLYQVMQRHTFIPEAFTMDFQVHWGQHPLRPEFLESTYFLYKATQDPHYLEVGKKVLRSLQKHARVACGFAAVNDVRTGKHEDRMDSFVLAETFKYLFLLFSEQADLVLDLDEFIFTTEAHLLPLSLGSYNDNGTIVTVRVDSEEDSGETEYSRTCPTTVTLFPESVRLPLQNLVSGQCHRRGSLSTRRLRAQDFQTSNPEHLKIVREMGISMLSLSDGRVQLLHTFSSARTPADAEEGLLFMQEMVELSKAQAQTPDAMPQAVLFPVTDGDGSTRQVMISAGPSHFGPELRGSQRVTARITIADPFRVCSALLNPDQINGHIVIMERGDCMFVDKARRVQAAGALAAIVVDNAPETSAANSPMFAMSGDGTDDVKIPVIFLFAKEAAKLREALSVSPGMEVMLGEMKSIGEAITQINVFNKVPDDIVERSKVNADDSRETSESSNKYIIKLNDFVAEIIDPFESPVVELSYKGAFKSDPEVEQTEDTTNISGKELGNSKWKALRKHILQIVQHSKLKVAYTSLTYYFTLVNELDDQSIKKGPVLDVLVRWLLNELEMERDSKSEFIFPSEIYAIALNVKGEEDIKNNVLNLLLNQVRRIEEIQKKLADWKQSDVLINVGNSVMSKVTMNDYLKIMSKYKTHHTISKDEIQEVYDEIISVSDERSSKEKVKNDEL